MQVLDRSERTGQRRESGPLTAATTTSRPPASESRSATSLSGKPTASIAPSAVCTGLQTRPVIAHQERVAKGECTADKRRAHLADTVPDNRSRFDT